MKFSKFFNIAVSHRHTPKIVLVTSLLANSVYGIDLTHHKEKKETVAIKEQKVELNTKTIEFPTPLQLSTRIMKAREKNVESASLSTKKQSPS